jgi:hypothetical protein
LREHGFATFHPDLVGFSTHQTPCTCKPDEVLWRFDLIFEMLKFHLHVSGRFLRGMLSFVPDEYHIRVLYIRQQVFNGGRQVRFCYCILSAVEGDVFLSFSVKREGRS